MTEFGRLLADLDEAGVRFVVIGGIALIGHGVVRATRDLDVVVAPDAANYDGRIRSARSGPRTATSMTSVPD